MNDPVHSPAHYTHHPVQPIEITRHLGFCLGNVIKYVLRAPYKGGVEDLAKASHYLKWEQEYQQPSMSVGAYRAVVEPLTDLAAHLRATENVLAADDDITDIQADILDALDGYLSDGRLEHLRTIHSHIAELTSALINRSKETRAA